MAKFYTVNPIRFYDDKLAPPPSGAFPITDARHTAIFAQVNQGYRIFADVANVLFTVAPAPLQPVSPVPISVTNFQARVALMQMSYSGGGTMFAHIDAVLFAAKDVDALSASTWQAWNFANNFERASATITRLGTLFGFSSTDLDNIFIAAAAIHA